MNLFKKFGDGGWSSGEPAPKVGEALISGAGGMLLIGILYAFHDDRGMFPIFIAPFGSSAALVFVAPASPFSQPRNVVLGHLSAALIGIATYASFATTAWWTVSLAGGLAIFCMALLKAIHPPAGATALLPVLAKIPDYAWALRPALAGAVIVVVFGMAYNNLFKNRRYPRFWL